MGALWTWLPAGLCVGVGVVAWYRLTERSLPEAPLPWHHVAVVMSCLVGYLMAVRVIDAWEPEGQSVPSGFELTRQFGLFVSTIAAALLVVGATRMARAEADRP